MFIVLLTYKKPLEEVDMHLAEHIAFLDEGYKKNYLIASGRRNPRVGGVLLSPLTNRAELEAYLELDSFKIHDIAEYQIIDFTPNRFHPNFEEFVK